MAVVVEFDSAAASCNSGFCSLSAAVQASERRCCASRSTACAAERKAAESGGVGDDVVDDDDDDGDAFGFAVPPVVAALASLPASLLSAATLPATRANPSKMRRQSAEWEDAGMISQ